MAPRTRTYVWEWWFDAPPSRVWPVVSDTNRLDRLAGLPPAVYAPVRPGIAAAGRLEGRQTVLGVLRFQYAEEPYAWVAGERYSVVRRYSRGPFARMDVDVRLVPEPRGTRVVMTTVIEPRSWRTAWLVAPGMRRAKRGFDAAYAAFRDEILEQPSDRAARRAVLRRALDRLSRLGDAMPADLSTLIATHVATADAVDLRRVRPFALADRWRCPRREVLAAFLAAVRGGVLELSWETLCPHCRGAGNASGARSLADVKATSRCASCEVDFDVELDRSLEAVFRPAADLRQVAPDLYCLGGPGSTPHVVAQRTVAKGARDAVSMTLAPGGHRVRAMRRAGLAVLHVEDDASLPAEAAIALRAHDVEATPTTVRAGAVRLAIENASGDDAVVVVERTAWLDDVATALDVLAVPGFRDVFTSEVLAPGERVAVRRIAILFTDLRGSTALYRRIGDAAAYALVREHFRVLRETVARHQGFVVKTIGDAVMASFASPAQAVAAALEMHAALAAMPVPDGCERLVLKAGVHQGSSIAVNAGGLLDFFGTTTNFAARAQHESAGGDVVLTAAVRDDEDVRRLLASVPHRAESFRARPKGFESDVPLERITPAASA